MKALSNSTTGSFRFVFDVGINSGEMSRCKIVKICLVLFLFGSSRAGNDAEGPEKPYGGYWVYLLYENKENPKFHHPNTSILTENLDLNYRGLIARTYLVFSSAMQKLEDYAKEMKAKLRILVPNLGDFIAAEKEKVGLKKWSKGDKFESKIYLSYDETKEYLKYISTIKNPSKKENIAKLESLGTTYHKREVFGVKISSDHKKKKPTILFEAGLRAREWVAMTAARYIINQLVENYNSNKNLLRDIDVYIIPMSNPDGYEYSRKVVSMENDNGGYGEIFVVCWRRGKNLQDRLWVKNRAVHVKYAQGVDLNRNFWLNNSDLASMSDPKSDKFRGPNPLSEKEAQIILNVGKKLQSQMKAFVSLQADNAVLVYPWSTKPEKAPNHKFMKDVAKKVTKAIEKTHSGPYQSGQGYQLQYNARGNIEDYFKTKFKVPLSYAMKISVHWKPGYLFPPLFVSEVVKNAFEGIKVIIQNVPKK